MQNAFQWMVAASGLTLAGVALAQPGLPAAPAEIDVAPAATTRVLFATAATPPNAKPLKHTRSFVAVRPDLAAALATNPGDSLVLRVADGVDVTMAVDVVNTRKGDRRSIIGRVEGFQHATAILVVEEDVVAGIIRIPTEGKTYKLRYVADGVNLVCDIDTSRFGECGGATAAPEIPGRVIDPVPGDDAQPPAPPGYTPRGSCSNIETTFDVMAIYSDVARVAAGGTNAIRAEIQLGCDTSNQTYDNSNVFAHYRLVWQGEVVYDENGPMTGHRDRLLDDADGYYDWAPTTKDTYNADLCSIWVDDDDGDQWCGFAFCSMTGDAAYCSINWECASSNFSYPHEHGHNQGCNHNTEDASGGCSEFSYSYGHRFFAGGDGYRTVMAYNQSGTYERVGYWSNPNINYLGVATGTATHDNARTLNDTRGDVEGWELTRYDIWIDLDPPFPAVQIGSWAYPYDTASEGFGGIGVPHASVSEVPTLHVVTGQYNYTGTVSKEMLVVPCGGSATIGTP